MAVSKKKPSTTLEPEILLPSPTEGNPLWREFREANLASLPAVFRDPTLKNPLETMAKASYDPTKANKLMERIEEGYTLLRAARALNIPPRLARAWVAYIPGLAKRFEIARLFFFDHMADELLDIADDGTNDWMDTDTGGFAINGEALGRSKMRLETRKWMLEKALPTVYGPRQRDVGDREDAPTNTKFIVEWRSEPKQIEAAKETDVAPTNPMRRE